MQILVYIIYFLGWRELLESPSYKMLVVENGASICLNKSDFRYPIHSTLSPTYSVDIYLAITIVQSHAQGAE